MRPVDCPFDALPSDSAGACTLSTPAAAQACTTEMPRLHYSRRQWLQSGMGLAAGAALSLPARASTPFPTKPVRIVVPFAPGGATDVLARTVGDKMGSFLGQTVLVENRPGAAGLIGGDVAAKAAPDGHTLYMGTTSTMLSMQFLFKKMPFDPQTHLTPVSRVCNAPIVMVVHSSVPARNVKELVEYARANPGKLSYGSYGIGSHAHLGGATLNQIANADMSHVAYKGEAPMTQELVGGSVKIGMGSLLSLKQHIDSGRLRAIAFTGNTRVPALPDVPTFSEQGYNQEALRITGWIGACVTGGTPPDIVEKLGAAFRHAIQSREVNARVLMAGFVPLSEDSPQQYRKVWMEEMVLWKRLLENANVQPN